MEVRVDEYQYNSLTTILDLMDYKLSYRKFFNNSFILKVQNFAVRYHVDVVFS